MKKGKSYTSRKKLKDRPDSDFYETPYCLSWELMKLDIFDFKMKLFCDPSCGNGAIGKILVKRTKLLIETDIMTGTDFLDDNSFPPGDKMDYIVTNPPFSLWDEFVQKAKRVTKEKIVFIGKTNFFGAYKRNELGIWDNLKHVYIFNRQIDYRYPLREDGKIRCGNLITGWFVWDMKWKKKWWKTSIIDINKYVIRKEK